MRNLGECLDFVRVKQKIKVSVIKERDTRGRW